MISLDSRPSPSLDWNIHRVSSLVLEESQEMVVTATFPDQRHQKIPLGQLSELKTHQIDYLVYDLTSQKIDFIFKDRAKGSEFLKHLQKSLLSSNQISPRCPPVSPREDVLFAEWEVSDAEATEIRRSPSVIATFNDFESRNVPFDQLSLFGQANIDRMRISLESPRIDFLFKSGEHRNDFLSKINQCVQKTLVERISPHEMQQRRERL